MIDERVLDYFKELGALAKGDFIKIEQYGGGPDESNLLATKNALLFMLESLKAISERVIDRPLEKILSLERLYGFQLV